ncbi:MAG: penicillin-binding transpeptidase domain-containing protein [Nitrospirota bacterium]
MKSKIMFLGIFGVWFLLILAAFFKYALTYDPFFGTTKNVVYRHQTRGEIKDRNGEVLAYGTSPRIYPIGSAGSPIIGVANPVIGSEGYLEQKYAELMISNRKSKLWYLLTQSDDGYPLKTTLDKNLQLAAYRSMSGNKGAIVIMKLNGEVIASVSTPSYDPNKMTKKYYSELTKSPDRPLFNRAFDGRYEPGSVWKTVIAMTLLEKNSKGRTIICNGSFRVGNKEIKCIRPHGLVKDMIEAFTLSCNVWFMKNALAELDDKTLRISFRRFMSREMKEELGPEDIALSAIGQGEVLVSPMELATLAATIGNKGMQPVPHVINENSAPSKVIEEKTAKKISDMMTMVVKRGTARGLSDYFRKGYFVAAKTGTAEKDNSKGKVNTAVLIGLAGRSTNKPEIAFSVVIEEAQGYGGTVCVPVMKEILDYYFFRGKR